MDKASLVLSCTKSSFILLKRELEIDGKLLK